jgi:hypothetical protein
MGLSMFLWKAPVVGDPRAAEALLGPFYQREDDSAFEASGDIARFAAELRRRFPDDPSLDPPDESSPWAEVPFRQSERVLVLALRPGAGDEILDAIADLAWEHKLVLYDPQGPWLFPPDDLADPEAEPEAPPGPGDWVRFALFTLGSVGMLALGRRLSVPVLDKVLTAFGGFLTAVSLFILVMYLVTRKRAR